MREIIVCENLSFKYKNTEVLHNVNLSVKQGGIVGLLGKNGAGKSTIINILMGFLQQNAGKCSVLGYQSFFIPPHVRAKIGLVHEGFTQYNFMSIDEIERYYSAYYPKWQKEIYYDLIDKMKVPHSRKISKLSCGQRSQVTLGLVLAQSPELLILDDFSMGLDVGYRRLFLEFLRDFVDTYKTTVLLTSHIISELDTFLDEIIILKDGVVVTEGKKEDFAKNFHSYSLPISLSNVLKINETIVNIEYGKKELLIFSFNDEKAIKKYLLSIGVESRIVENMTRKVMNLEDAFIGLTGRY
ncbi:MAG: ABC transporter ATP-binding protein [Campylobacteraceae bacterium]|jgi:ABC-2 type transport system ATP-binding protein|nr:ABC transporter ATP-binding protein [Campylobacteraceae bacterium]